MKQIIIMIVLLCVCGIGSAHTNISTSDDFIIQIADATGDIDAVYIDSTSILMNASTNGGFEYREHFTNGTISAWYTLQGSVTSHADNTVTYNSTHNDINFNFTYTPCARQTSVSCEINDAQQIDSAVQIRYILPANATGWYWGEYINQHDLIGVGVEYSNTYLIGDTRKQNTYPFSSLNNSTIGMGIAIPMDVPRIYRIRYDTSSGGYSIEYDIGIANCTDKIGNSSANFTFIIYKMDEPEWGFRAVAKKYYELYPEFFVKRNEIEGIWICGHVLSGIPDISEFGVAFDDAHYYSSLNRVYDHDRGIYPMQYTEPVGWWRDFGSNSTEPSYDEKITALINDSENGTGMWDGAVTTKFAATAALNTAPYDKNGSQYLDNPYHWVDWGTWQQNYPENPDPDIPSPNRYDISYAKYLRSNKSGVYAYNWTFGSSNCSIDTIAYSGTYSGKIEILGTSDVQSEIITSDRISVAPSTTYNFSVWGKTLDCGGSYCPCARVAEYDSSNIYITQTNLEFGFGTNDWTEKTTAIATTADTAYIGVYANFWRGYGTFWFDDAELYESGSGDNLVKNHGFESVYNASDYPCSGFRVDSLTTTNSWAKIENYRREHWKYTDHPLVFSYDTKQPVLLGTLSHYDCISVMHENMTDMGKRVDANIFSYAYSFHGHLVDVLGSEVWELQMDDDDASLYRTMSYQKTNRNLLQWTRYGNDSITNDEMEIYMNSQMFYGMFPSITVASPDGRYWDNATLYERDRDMFKKYIPIIKNISAAGWEPIPYATCDNPDIKFERYGDTVGDIYFTIRGNSSTSENGNITVHTKTIGMQDNYFVVSDILTGVNKLYFVANDATTFAVSVDNDATSVYSLSTPTHAKAYYNTNSSIINTVNSTGYIEYNNLYGDHGDMVCSSGSLKVTTS